MAPRNASDFYFYDNLMHLSDEFMEAYERHEAIQYKLRRTAMAKMLSDDGIDTTPRNGQTMFGISSMKGQCVILTEI